MGQSVSLEEGDFRSLIDSLDRVAIWVVSDPSEFEYVSAGAEDLWGIPAAELQRDPRRLLDAIHPEDRDRIRREMMMAGDEVDERRYEARAVMPDGTEKWVATRQLPVRDDDGDLRYVVGICTDITEQKRRELEYEALNRILRHDIRNDMTVIQGWAEMLEDHVDDGGQDRLRKLMSAAENVIGLTDVAHDYAEAIAREGDTEVRPVALRSTLQDEVDVRREVFPGANFYLADDVPDVEVRANELLSSVFRNLLNNAVQHNDADEPVVEIGVDVDADEVIVSVADNGPGIPDDVTEALFEKGVKGAGSSGTGLGLHLVRTLVDQYGGTIDVTDDEPRGTAFEVRLRRVGGDAGDTDGNG